MTDSVSTPTLDPVAVSRMGSDSEATDRRRRRGRLVGVAAAGALLSVGLVLRLINAWTDLDALSFTTLPDDAFYYFGIARHVALGDPPSIDGVNPTNGYHPLWLLLLVPLYLFGDPNEPRLPVHLALTLGAVLDVLAAVLLHRLTGRLRWRLGVRLLVLGWYALAAYRVQQATSGMETPLAMALILALLNVHVEARRPQTPRWLRSPWLFGLVGGATILARTDLVILVAALLGTRLLGVWRCPAEQRTLRVRWLLHAAGGTVLVVAPWLAVSTHTTGTLWQSSGLALPMISWRIPAVWGYDPVPLGLQAERILSCLTEAVQSVGRMLGFSTALLLVLLGAGATAMLVARGRLAQLVSGEACLGLPLVLAMVVFLLTHTAVRLVFREWYTPPILLATMLPLGVGLDAAARQMRRPRWVLGGVAVLGLVSTAAEWHRWQTRGLFPKAHYSQMVPGSEVHEGHTDCGAVSYFTMGKIANLDGIANQQAFEALRAGQLLRYLKEQDFSRVYATDFYHSAVFFGPRYRESLIQDPHDVRAVRLVHDPAAKDRLITLGHQPVSLGGVQGREFLSDGWIWVSEPPREGWATSVGYASEIVFSLDTKPKRKARLRIELRSLVENSRGVQPVRVRLNGELAAKLRVGPRPRTYWIRLKHARVGRNRLRLEYGAAGPSPRNRVARTRGWWHAMRGRPVAAVAAAALSIRAWRPWRRR